MPTCVVFDISSKTVKLSLLESNSTSTVVVSYVVFTSQMNASNAEVTAQEYFWKIKVECLRAESISLKITALITSAAYQYN